jgi:hypothetical protein
MKKMEGDSNRSHFIVTFLDTAYAWTYDWDKISGDTIHNLRKYWWNIEKIQDNNRVSDFLPSRSQVDISPFEVVILA